MSGEDYKGPRTGRKRQRSGRRVLPSREEQRVRAHLRSSLIAHYHDVDPKSIKILSVEPGAVLNAKMHHARVRIPNIGIKEYIIHEDTPDSPKTADIGGELNYGSAVMRFCNDGGFPFVPDAFQSIARVSVREYVVGKSYGDLAAHLRQTMREYLKMEQPDLAYFLGRKLVALQDVHMGLAAKIETFLTSHQREFKKGLTRGFKDFNDEGYIERQLRKYVQGISYMVNQAIDAHPELDGGQRTRLKDRVASPLLHREITDNGYLRDHLRRMLDAKHIVHHNDLTPDNVILEERMISDFTQAPAASVPLDQIMRAAHDIDYRSVMDASKIIDTTEVRKIATDPIDVIYHPAYAIVMRADPSRGRTLLA
ncbi:MAG: hypothetical protein ABIH41_01630, partial [Nanoarchaeota archaeon]